MAVPFKKQIRYLSQYLRPHKGVLIFSFCLSVVSTALGMIQPLVAKLLIDVVLPGRHFKLLLLLMGAVIGLLILSFVIRVGNSYLYTRFSAGILFRMREDLFEHLQEVPLVFFSKKKLGDVLSRVGTDMADIQALLTEIVPNFFFNFMTCLITTGILLWLNWRMALLSFVFLPAALLLLKHLKPRLIRLARSVAETNADISHFLFESLAGTSLVRAFDAGRMILGRLREKHRSMLALLLRYQVLGVVSGSIPLIYTLLNTVLVYGYGGYLVIGGSLSMGSLVAFAIYQGRVFGPLQALIDGFLALQKSQVAMERVSEILEVAPAFEKKGHLTLQPSDFKGEIRFDRVDFDYTPQEPLFRDLSFHIPARATTALVGPSGAGKTTVCHLAMRLMDPTGGRITLDGLDLRDLDLHWLRKQFALVSQDTFLFNDTILENIRFSKPRAHDEEIYAAARAACIHDFILGLPEGYRTLVGDRGIRLSGGQKQRVSIARAILTDPKVLVLDEATAFLDTSAEEHLKATLARLKAGKTIILVSHRASTVESAQKIIALGEQGLLYEGPAGEYRERKPNVLPIRPAR